MTYWLRIGLEKGIEDGEEGIKRRRRPGVPALPGNQSSTREIQHHTQLLRAPLILSSQFMKGGQGNVTTMDRAFRSSLEETSAGG